MHPSFLCFGAAYSSGKRKGFTLIELMVTLAILAVLATLTVPAAQAARRRMQEQELRQALREIRHGIDAYKQASSDGRIQHMLGSSNYPKDLQTLVEGVPDQRDPKHNNIYFLRSIPRDPMNSSPDLENADTWGKRSYASPPDDPQEGDDVYDVYSTSTMVGSNGIPYNKW